MLSYGVKDRTEQLLSHRASVIASSLTALGALLGCTELDPTIDDCESIGGGLVQCERALGAAGTENIPEPPDDPFDCLPEGEPPFAGFTPAPPFVSYVTAIVDATAPNPDVALPGLQVRVCLATDTNCDNPVPSIVAPVPNAPAAAASILMPYGLDGYLVLTATGYVPQEYYFGGRMIGAPTADNPDGELVELEVPPQAAALIGVPAGTRVPTPVVRGEPIVMLRESQTSGLFSDLAGPGVQRDPETGLLALRMIDCRGDRAGGVSLELNAELGQGIGFVVTQNNISRPSNPANPAGVTESRQGGAGFANIRPGVYSPYGVLEDGRTYGGQVGFRVRPNVFTNGEIRPSYPYGR